MFFRWFTLLWTIYGYSSIFWESFLMVHNGNPLKLESYMDIIMNPIFWITIISLEYINHHCSIYIYITLTNHHKWYLPYIHILYHYIAYMVIIVITVAWWFHKSWGYPNQIAGSSWEILLRNLLDIPSGKPTKNNFNNSNNTMIYNWFMMLTLW